VTRPWLAYATATTLLWGVWGALFELPEKAGFPATLGYVAWTVAMIPCAAIALRIRGAGPERQRAPALLGLFAGVTGAGGQLALFQALRTGPAYLVFPVVSLYPVVTIVLSVLLLRERAPRRHWLGVALALPAIVLLSYVPPSGRASGIAWVLLALFVMATWGVQGWALKLANERMSAEGLFFYMTVASAALAPVALAMTDFRGAINWGGSGAGAALGVQVLNAAGALMFVYAIRFGKAIVVVPLTALAPVITVALSLAIYGRTPLPANAAGMALALVSIWLMAT
jgi:drug/metabolite transporter (DMT)-like permease